MTARKLFLRSSVLCAGYFLTVFASPLRAAVITFSDGTFIPSNWSITTQTIGPGGDASATQHLSGGPTGANDAYRQVTINVTGGSDSEVYAFNLMGSAVYNPASQGAISALNYSEDRDTSTGQEFGPALMQTNSQGITKFYYAYAGYADTGNPTPVWQTATLSLSTVTGATPSIPSDAFRTYLSASDHPDFSTAGTPITFGFAAINTSTASTTTGVSSYDNWSIALTTAGVPEPATALIFPLVIVLFCRRPSRVQAG